MLDPSIPCAGSPRIAAGPQCGCEGPTISSTRKRLKLGTQECHLRLEARLPITGPKVGLAEYRDHLEYLAGFHAWIEKRLCAVRNLRRRVPDLDLRWKAPKLRRDLGWDVDEPSGDARLAGKNSQPRLDTVADALGVLYVLEGASLGARSLLATLRRQAVVPGPVGCEYLEGYGGGTRSMWNRFCGYLEETPAEAVEPTLVAARSTFSALVDWRERWEERR